MRYPALLCRASRISDFAYCVEDYLLIGVSAVNWLAVAVFVVLEAVMGPKRVVKSEFALLAVFWVRYNCGGAVHRETELGAHIFLSLVKGPCADGHLHAYSRHSLKLFISKGLDLMLYLKI